jgi:hypothetical protein
VVRRREKVTITRAQWAWRRWYVAEKAFGSTRVADQEMPTIWEDAFNASQDRPFLDEVTCDRVREGLTNPSDAYIYRWGPNLEDTSTEPVPDRVPPMLRVWALPDHRPVVIAAVPAHAIIEDDPQWVISVWAADLARERIEQVAEFSTELTVGLQPFAWTCLHLTGSYRVEHQCFILEINGLGMGVLAEIKRLIYSGWGTANTPAFRDLLGSVRHYIWRRPDSIGAMGAYQWKSTDELQAVALHRLRDQIQRGIAVVRSEALLDELERLEGHGEGFEATGEMPRAHRAYAAALAMESYSAQLYPELRRYQPEQSASSVAQLTVQRFLSGLAAR